jgi:hypothetical protein
MSDFFSYAFFVIGFCATIFGTVAAIFWAMDRSDKAKRERDERHRELVRKLGDIEFQLKLTKDAK